MADRISPGSTCSELTKKRVFLASLKEIDVANIGPAGPIKLVRILNRSIR
jgi:hypothetical protein